MRPSFVVKDLTMPLNFCPIDCLGLEVGAISSGPCDEQSLAQFHVLEEVQRQPTS